MKLIAPWLTPERLYIQDKKKREWDAKKRITIQRLEQLDWYRKHRIRQIEDEIVKLELRQYELVDERRRLLKIHK